ncbi:uncharacterized protein LOC123517516 [Portunus trituberculatus]|uniref:uncharacterized protein LOC123517516 n=1 Tax=Portunus trituberculatus TaxID=210409 RepID=UPI001E1D1F39|nr:uncharacterized protein LOC123517516 [Portunus trituberculatus]
MTRAADLPVNLLAVMAVAAMWPQCFSFSQVSPQSVHYISSSAMGDFLFGTGKRVEEQDSYLTLNVNNKSACRVACWTHPNCASAGSTSNGDGAVQCRLAEAIPSFIEIADDPNATLSFWPEKSKIGKYEIREDGLLYLQSAWKAKLTDVQKWCGNLPGHRLPTIKTPSHLLAVKTYMEQTGRKPWVDLKLKDGILVWGDDTPFDNSTVASSLTVLPHDNGNPNAIYYFMKSTSSVKADTMGSFHHTLCQANPLGVDW